jgi:hypothetical protein
MFAVQAFVVGLYRLQGLALLCVLSVAEHAERRVAWRLRMAARFFNFPRKKKNGVYEVLLWRLCSQASTAPPMMAIARQNQMLLLNTHAIRVMNSRSTHQPSVLFWLSG